MATLVNRKWMSQGEPVRIAVPIRNEDERRRVGDYMARLMEQLGFGVDSPIARFHEVQETVHLGLGDPNVATPFGLVEEVADAQAAPFTPCKGGTSGSRMTMPCSCRKNGKPYTFLPMNFMFTAPS